MIFGLEILIQMVECGQIIDIITHIIDIIAHIMNITHSIAHIIIGIKVITIALHHDLLFLLRRVQQQILQRRRQEVLHDLLKEIVNRLDPFPSGRAQSQPKGIYEQTDLIFIRFLLRERFFQLFEQLLPSHHQTVEVFGVVADGVEVFVVLLQNLLGLVDLRRQLVHLVLQEFDVHFLALATVARRFAVSLEFLVLVLVK